MSHGENDVYTWADPARTRVGGEPPRGWTLIWLGAKLALAPQRLGLSVLAVVLLMGLGTLFDTARGELDAVGHGAFAALSGSVIVGVGELARGVMTLNPTRAAQGLSMLVFGPAALARVAPWTTGGLALVLLPVWAVMGGAVSRSAVAEVSRGRTLTGAQAVAYAARRWASLIGAYLIPAATCGVLAGVIWLFGKAMLTLAGVDVAGGALYGVALVLGFLLAVVAWGLAVGFPLLIPAVAADSADAVDAVQRAYAFVVDTPFRLVVWGAAAAAQGAAAVFVVAVLVVSAVNWTAGLTGAEASGMGGDVGVFMPMPEREGLEGTAAVAGYAVGLWERAALAVVGAYGLCVFFCGSTVVYLRVREASDGQAVGDVWPRDHAMDAVKRGDLRALADTHDG